MGTLVERVMGVTREPIPGEICGDIYKAFYDVEDVEAKGNVDTPSPFLLT